jgi:hypothetical protein
LKEESIPLYQFGSIARKFKQKPLTAEYRGDSLAATTTSLAAMANSIRGLRRKHPSNVEVPQLRLSPVPTNNQNQLRGSRPAAPGGLFLV